MDGWRPVLYAAVGAALLVGCSSGTGGGAGASGKPATSPDSSTDSGTGPGSGAGSGADSGAGSGASAPAEATAEPYTLAEERAPKTRGEAVAFVRGLEVRPDCFGTGYRRRDPCESGPARWALLGEDCLWRCEALPDTVLAGECDRAGRGGCR